MRTVAQIGKDLGRCYEKIRALEAERDDALLKEHELRVGDVVEIAGIRGKVAGIRYVWIQVYPEKKGGGWSKKARTIYDYQTRIKKVKE